MGVSGVPNIRESVNQGVASGSPGQYLAYQSTRPDSFFSRTMPAGSRSAAQTGGWKTMVNGHPCVNFVFANNDGTMFCTNIDTFGHSKTGEWYAEESKKI